MTPRNIDWITTSVVFGALMLVVPLALTLARSYGFVDDVDFGRRSTGALVGWTWVLCGLGSALAWFTLSIDVAETATTILVVTAMFMTIVQILRLRRPRKPQPV